MDLKTRFQYLLIYSHFIIAAAATALTYETYALAGLKPSIPYLSLVFFGTLALYAAHRFIQAAAYGHVSDDRVTRLQRYRILFLVTIGIGGIVSLYLGIEHFLSQWRLLIIPGALGLIYIMPWTKTLRRFRDLPYIKVFFIAFCWMWVSLTAPLQLENELTMNTTHISWMIERLLFVLAITLPFDIRDARADHQKGIATMVSAFGISKVKRGAIAILGLSFLFAAMTFGEIFSVYSLIGLSLILLMCMNLISKVHAESGEIVYSLYLDGIIILRGLIIAVLAYNF